jgi:hypothetical protein
MPPRLPRAIGSAELKDLMERAAEKGDIAALSQYDEVCARYASVPSHNHERSRDRRIRELWAGVPDADRRALLLEVIKPLHEDELRVSSRARLAAHRPPQCPIHSALSMSTLAAHNPVLALCFRA